MPDRREDHKDQRPLQCRSCLLSDNALAPAIFVIPVVIHALVDVGKKQPAALVAVE